MAKKEEKEINKKNFLKEYKAELKKVIWPTPKQLINNTIAVISIVLLTAIIVFALDFIFDLFNKYGIAQMQSKVKTTFTQNSIQGSNETAESNSIIDNTIVETINQIDTNTVNKVENTSVE